MEAAPIKPQNLFDTDLLIDYSRGVEEAAEFLEQSSTETLVSISVITQMELTIGCRNKKELKELKQLLKRFKIVPLDRRVSEKAISLLEQYNLSHNLLIADALIAATALVNNIPLATRNQRDFRFHKGVEIDPLPSYQKGGII